MAEKTFIGMGMIAFTGVESWAEGNAQWLKDNTEQLAQQAALVAPGEAGERTSWFGAFELQADGTLQLVSAWHVDDNGTVQQGLPDVDPPTE